MVVNEESLGFWTACWTKGANLKTSLWSLGSCDEQLGNLLDLFNDKTVNHENKY